MYLSKPCKTCGREFQWRKKWEKNWDDVVYCSKKCSSQKPNQIDTKIEDAILSLLAKRSKSSTICPSEAARLVFTEEDWQPQMERTRCAARRLAHKGKITISQNGKQLDPSTFKGPIRLKKK
jgi:hypothetical protein